MELLIAFATFTAVTLTVYGLFYKPASDDPMDSRLGGLRYVRPGHDPVPDPDAAFGARVLKPLARSFAGRANAILPSNVSERLAGALVRAGLGMTAGQFILVVAITAGVLPFLFLLYLAGSGASTKNLVMFYGAFVLLGSYGPRMWLAGRIKHRQKLIWRSLPDAFDLITASVEAGLGIDAAFSRVLDKVTGPFAEELSRAMREITMGRPRREAFMDMADRTGVEELRSLVNAIVQAESMGISIGSVIRVQTGVIRTKRRQRAEEQAFKAPIKMVFPLVFFIFPCIMTIIGGPALIELRSAF